MMVKYKHILNGSVFKLLVLGTSLIPQQTKEPSADINDVSNGGINAVGLMLATKPGEN